MWLLLEHPKVATRRCDDCLKWQYDEETGAVQRLADGSPMPRRGEAPCRYKERMLASGVHPDSPSAKQAGCPKGTPETSRELSEVHWQTYDHYLDCKAVGQFPDDPIVRRNAGVIRRTEDAHERRKRESLEQTLLAFLQALAAR